MRKTLTVLLSLFVLQCSVDAADRIRIGFPGVAMQFVPLPLGAKRGFFEEEGLQAEFIQMLPTVGMAAFVSGGIDYWAGVASTVPGGQRLLPPPQPMTHKV